MSVIVKKDDEIESVSYRKYVRGQKNIYNNEMRSVDRNFPSTQQQQNTQSVRNNNNNIIKQTLGMFRFN